MSQFGGKDSKRHFTVVLGGKEHGLYVSSTPSSAAKKAVTKLCTANKSKKVEFHIREITQGSKKKTYGPYEGHIEKLKEPIELKGRVIKYKPVAKLSRKKGVMKGGALSYMDFTVNFSRNKNPTYKYDSSWRSGGDKLFFGEKFIQQVENPSNKKPYTTHFFPFVLYSDGRMKKLYKNKDHLTIQDLTIQNINSYKQIFNLPSDKPEFSTKMKDTLSRLRQQIQSTPVSNIRQQIQSTPVSNSRYASNLYPKIAPKKIKCTQNIEDYIVSNNESYKYDEINNQLFFGTPVSEQFDNSNKLIYPFSICIGDSNIQIIAHTNDGLDPVDIKNKEHLVYLKNKANFFNQIDDFISKNYQQNLSNELSKALLNLQILGLSIDNS